MDTTNPSGQVNIVSFSVNGNRQSQNKWTIDGVDNVDHGSNITLLVYPSVDAISEFKVSRSNARGIFQGPLCTAVDSDGACTATGTQITDIDPVAAAYLQDVYSKIPLPPADDGLLFSVFPGVFNYREELVRVDHVVSSRLMGRAIWDRFPTKEPFGLFGPQSNIPGVATTAIDSPGHQYMGRATLQLTRHTFNEIGVNIIWRRDTQVLSDYPGRNSRTPPV